MLKTQLLVKTLAQPNLPSQKSKSADTLPAKLIGNCKRPRALRDVLHLDGAELDPVQPQVEAGPDLDPVRREWSET